jgi:hypothetical protein
MSTYTTSEWVNAEDGALTHCGRLPHWYECDLHNECYGVRCSKCGAELPTDCLDTCEVPA